MSEEKTSQWFLLPMPQEDKSRLCCPRSSRTAAQMQGLCAGSVLGAPHCHSSGTTGTHLLGATSWSLCNLSQLFRSTSWKAVVVASVFLCSRTEAFNWEKNKVLGDLLSLISNYHFFPACPSNPSKEGHFSHCWQPRPAWLFLPLKPHYTSTLWALNHVSS